MTTEDPFEPTIEEMKASLSAYIGMMKAVHLSDASLLSYWMGELIELGPLHTFGMLRTAFYQMMSFPTFNADGIEIHMVNMEDGREVAPHETTWMFETFSQYLQACIHGDENSIERLEREINQQTSNPDNEVAHLLTMLYGFVIRLTFKLASEVGVGETELISVIEEEL